MRSASACTFGRHGLDFASSGTISRIRSGPSSLRLSYSIHKGRHCSSTHHTDNRHHWFDSVFLSIFLSQSKMLGALSRVAKKSLAASSLPSELHLHRPAILQQKRFLNVHEYISMELMASHGIQVPECHVAESAQEVEHIFNTSFHHKRTSFLFFSLQIVFDSIFYLLRSLLFLRFFHSFRCL